MPTGRPRHSHGHKLKNPTSPVLRVAAIAAPLVTLAAVGVGVSNVGFVAQTAPASVSIRGSLHYRGVPLEESLREQKASRSTDRLQALASEGNVARKKITRFATTTLNVRTSARQNARVLDVVKPGARLIATGIRDGGFAEVRYQNAFRWVTAQYLSADKPATPAAPATAATSQTVGLSDAPCPDGSVENGLTSSAIHVYRTVCHSFPQITSYGGYAPRGEHSSGKAIDIMTSDVALGTQIAEFLRAHASELNLYDVIWRQQIWTPVRSSEGWRSMSDRGSTTANHYDHVHVSVN
ncbi:MAG: SH3 domain-containing protein [Marmoricola sp.]